MFNNGELSRDFTYIDDIVNGVVNTLLEDSKNEALYKLYNIGNSSPVKLLDFIEAIEEELEVSAIKDYAAHASWGRTSNLGRRKPAYNAITITNLKTSNKNRSEPIYYLV